MVGQGHLSLLFSGNMPAMFLFVEIIYFLIIFDITFVFRSVLIDLLSGCAIKKNEVYQNAIKICQIYICFVCLFSDIYKTNDEESTQWTCLWLFNPLIIGISTRGSADCLMSFFMCLILYLVAQRKIITASLIYALAIIFKIFPVIFALGLYLNFQLQSENRNPSNIFAALLKQWRKIVVPNKQSWIFFISSFIVLVTLLMLTYWMYGYEAIFETYIYHLVRKDTKHNFSVYFLMYYLNDSTAAISPNVIEYYLICFLPLLLQAVCLVFIGVKFYDNLPMCFFLSIYSFVSLNKVCTSQYFVWYLTFLPMVAYQLKITFRHAFGLIILWVVTQLLWLYPAYLLEFEGINTFEFIWIASMIFFLANMYIMREIVQCYDAKLRETKTIKTS